MYSDHSIKKITLRFNPRAFPHTSHTLMQHVMCINGNGKEDGPASLSSCTAMPGREQAVSTSLWLAHSWKSSSNATQLNVFLNEKESTQFADLLYFVIFECISAPDTLMSAIGILLSFSFIQARIKESSILWLY